MSKTKYNPLLLDVVQYCELVDLFDERKDVPANDPIYKKNPVRNFYAIKKDTDICVVSIEAKRLVICFQGSKDKEDWKNNFEGLRKIAGIHEGWCETFYKFKDDIIRLVSTEGNNRRIYFFGHSRGGALAILGSYFVASILGLPVNCITFGAPLVGDARFRDKYRELPINSTRCVISRDPVPKIPPKFAGYKCESFIKELNDKPWYFLPLPGIGIKCHLDYYDNVKRWS